MKKYLLVAAASIFAFAACKKSSNTTPATNGPTAKAIFVNAIVSPDSARVKINDTLQPSFNGLAYSTAAGYYLIRAGNNIKITFYSPITGVELLTSNQNITQDSSYTFYATGDGTTKNLLVTTDNLAAPSAGNAKIRFINLSPTGFGAKILLDNVAVDSNINYLGMSPFRQVPANSYNVKMGDPGTFTFGSITSQSLQAGKIYTFILTGTTTGSGNFALKLSTIANN